MKDFDRDILAERPELKKMPYNLPEGYFEEFKQRMKPPGRQLRWNRTMSFVSIAASVAVLVTAGLLLLQPSPTAEEFTYEDFLVFTKTGIDPDMYEYTEQYADAELTNNDIIDYLIYSGISAEEIEYYK